MILVIDNFDSFVHNLARYVGELGFERRTIRTDEISVEDALALAPDAIILSPGPCGPDKAGISVPLVTAAAARGIPLLGVCLGHQAIAAAHQPNSPDPVPFTPADRHCCGHCLVPFTGRA